MQKIHLNYSLTDVNERLSNVREELEKIDDELIDYFDNKYNPDLGTTNDASVGKPLSENDRVCKKLQQMADFLLYSPDIRKESRSDIREKKSRKESYIARGNSLRNDDECQNLRDLLDLMNNCITHRARTANENFKPMPNIAYSANDKSSRNYKKKIEQKIYAKDIKENPIIAEYQASIDLIRGRLATEKNTYYRRQQMYKIMSTTRDDQVRIKDIMKGTIYPKMPLPDTTLVDWWLFNFTNKGHIKALLRFNLRNYNFNNYIHCLVYDLNQLIDKCDFDDLKLEIIRKYRQNASLSEIGKDLGLRRQSVFRHIQTIISKIIRQYKTDRENWLCIHYVRGTYKQCRGKCKEVKLVSQFANNKTEKDGYARVCRQCEKDRRKK